MKTKIIFLTIIVSALFLLTACPWKLPWIIEDDKENVGDSQDGSGQGIDYVEVLIESYWTNDAAECNGNNLNTQKAVMLFYVTAPDKSYGIYRSTTFDQLTTALGNPCPNVSNSWRSTIQDSNIINTPETVSGTWKIEGNVVTVEDGKGQGTFTINGDIIRVGLYAGYPPITANSTLKKYP